VIGSSSWSTLGPQLGDPVSDLSDGHTTGAATLPRNYLRRRRRQDIDVELVALGVSHDAPAEAFQLAGTTGFKPPAAKRFDLGGGRVQVLDNQINVQAVLPDLRFWDVLEPDRQAVLGPDSTTNWPSPIMLSTSTFSSPHQNPASRPGSMASITRYPIEAFMASS